MERDLRRGRGLEKDLVFLYFIWKHVSWRDGARLLGINGNTGRLVVGGGTPRPLWNRWRGRMSHPAQRKESRPSIPIRDIAKCVTLPLIDKCNTRSTLNRRTVYALIIGSYARLACDTMCLHAALVLARRVFRSTNVCKRVPAKHTSWF